MQSQDALTFFAWLPDFLTMFWNMMDKIRIGSTPLLGIIFAVGAIIVTIRALLSKG